MSTPRERRRESLDALLRPRTVAVLGASATRHASGNQALANLRAAGFPGQVHVVHPVAEQVAGIAALPTIGDLPERIDVALVSLPAPSVVPALLELEARGCHSALVPTVGLDAADRTAFQQIRARATMAVHGPNCFGLLNVSDGIPLVFWDGWLVDEARGPIALLAQSGGAAVGVIKSMTSPRLSKILPTGNEWDLSTADYLDWLADDPDTEVVGVVLESIPDLDAFIRGVYRLRENGKLLVALKAGRSTLGAELAVSHTAGLVGAAAAYEALFSDLDVPLARDFDQLASLLEVLARHHARTRTGTGIAVVTESGGIAALAADLAAEHRVPLAALGEAARDALQNVLPGCEPANPFDSGGSTSWTGDAFAQAIEIVGSDPTVGAVVVVADAQDSFTDAELAQEQENFDAIHVAAARLPDVAVIAASSTSAGIHAKWRSELEGIALVRGIPNALLAAAALDANAAPVPANLRSRLEAAPPAAIPLTAVGPMPHDLVQVLATEHGIPLVRSVVVSQAAAAPGKARDLDYPLVAKISSPDIAHRSDIGGVITDIGNAEQLIAACELIERRVRAAAPEARVHGFEIQEQIAGLEAIVGFVDDPVMGPLVSVGSGGVLVELISDTAVALAPLDPPRALELVRSTGLAALADGFRSLAAPTPLEQLADVVSAVSRMAYALRGQVQEGEFNPVIVEQHTGRVRAVDALLVASPASSEEPS